MTLEEIRRSDKAFLTPGDIAPVLGSDPQGAFLKFMEGGEQS